MGGLLIFFLGALYIWGAAKVVGLVETGWAKAMLILVFVLIPTADAVYGRIKLHQMCEAEGGLHIYRVIEGAEGFDDPESRPDESWLRIYKYQFIEGKELSGKRSRLSQGLDGTFLREEGITPVSKYIYEEEHDDRNNVYHRYEQHIRVKASGEILGRYIDFNYAGGWFEQFVAGLYAARGTAGTCSPFIPASRFVPQILKSIPSELSQ